MSNTSTREKEFWRLYNNAREKIGEPSWCFVGEVSLENYNSTPDSDFETAANILKEVKNASECWNDFASAGSLSSLYEVHINPAIAIAIAIKVFICPEVEILLGFETSKYSEGEVDYWWAISPIASQGVELSSENKCKSYLSHLKKGLEFVIEDGDFEIVDGTLEAYNGSETDIVIPERVNKIGNYAFDYSDISSVVIPDSVKKIEYNAFSFCENLVSVKMPQKIKMIDNHTFYNCIKLTSIEIPNGVTKIGSNAFANCSSLQSATLPDTVTEIKSQAFYGCSNLNTITVPHNLVKLGKEIFTECCSLSKVIPSKNVKTFKNSSLELVWNQICKELKPFNEVIARILTFWLSDYNELIKDEDSVVKKIKTLKSEILNYCIQTDDDIALNNLLSIIKLKIEEVDTYIEMANSNGSTKTCAFLLGYKESNFSKKQLSNYDKKVEKNSSDATNRSLADWKEIFCFETVNEGLIITYYKGKESVVEIPAVMGKKQVVAIRNGILSDPCSVKEIVVPNDTIAFSREGYSNYKITVLEVSGEKTSEWKTKTLKDGTIKLMFYCRYDTETVKIPDNIDGKPVTVLGENLFSGHKEVNFVEIPESVVELERDCLYGANLKELNLPKNLKIIGTQAIPNIKWIDVPASVEKVCGGAFMYAKNVIIRGNPKLITNLTIFGMYSNVYANPDTETYRYCKEKLGENSWYKVKTFPLSELPKDI